MTGRFELHDASPSRSGGPLETLSATCRTARIAMDAAAVSISVIDDDGLRYVAADGAGADEIVGTVLTGGRGLASYVAASGQSLAVSQPQSDPRFARDVAARTGYVPDALVLVPVSGSDGDPVGVLTVLDPYRTAARSVETDALSLAAAFAELATGPIERLDRATDEATALLDRLHALGPERRAAVEQAITAMIDALDS